MEMAATYAVVNNQGKTMKIKKLTLTFILFITTLTQSQSAFANTNASEAINDVFANATGWFVSFIFAPMPGTTFPWIVTWLVIGAVVFTFYFKFIQFRAIKHAVDLVKGDYSDPAAAGEVSHFQALTTALSGTVGLGNIAGVAVAISIGGPGATFWMILAGLFGMASKFTECTLGVKYRTEKADGTVSGGPMHYISKGFAEKGLPGGKVLAVIFAVFCVLSSFGAGNMFQVNQAHAQISSIIGSYPGWITGVIFAVIIFSVIVGGIKSIANVSEKVVPFMAVLYVAAALVILGVNADKIGWAFSQIFQGAFTGLGVTGGIVGALIQGFKRAAFSNEAGVGSAPIAHSAVKTSEPITEGLVSLLEPFIDTVVICTLTALVILTTIYQPSIAEEGIQGVELTSKAFASTLSWSPIPLSLIAVLFAFSTMISWSYYGLKGWSYIFGESKTAEIIFKILFCSFVVFLLEA
jgi:AGCS family alanine or glycine:cation symporter